VSCSALSGAREWNYRCQSSDGPNTFTYPFTPTQQNPAIEHEPQVLPNDISGTLFQPTSTDTGLGMDQFRFFGNPAFNRWGLSCNNE
jgi:hypothetical protein